MATQNIALSWFQEFGASLPHDPITLRNITDAGFVSHAKQAATDAECAQIDAAVSRAAAMLQGA